MEAHRNKFSVAVVGDKGVGKTRLIQQVRHSQSYNSGIDFRYSIFWVDL